LAILLRLGCLADVVANGEEAIARLSTTPYDLVFMDVQMPLLDGLETTRQIRSPQSEVHNPEIPIIALTASATAEDRRQCLTAGMNDYIPKPISPTSVLLALAKWLPQPPTNIREQAQAAQQAALTEALKTPLITFDLHALLARLLGDEAMAVRICRGYLNDLPQQIESLRGELANEDLAGVTRQAHLMKGAATTMGGEALRLVAWEMERAAQSGDPKVVWGHLPELEKQATRLLRAIERYVKGQM